MIAKLKQEAQNPLILRCHRLMEAFAKSDDERDFYLDRVEGFIIYADLDKPESELTLLENELRNHHERYCMIPKLTFYEIKKIMEGFVNEKVYDIDTKEKLLDIIQSKEARDNFLEFIYDHHAELEKWQLYYQERSRIRIIEWLRVNHFTFVFEEDLDLAKSMIEKLKRSLFDPKAGKDIVQARKALFAKSKTYYSNEALNPRPKRGRPPKQAVKTEIEPQITTDIYLNVPASVRQFLFIPDITSISAFTFSSKFGSEAELLSRKGSGIITPDMSMESLNLKLASLRSISTKWMETEQQSQKKAAVDFNGDLGDDEDDDDFDEDEEDEEPKVKKAAPKKEVEAKKKAAPAKAKATPPKKEKEAKPATRPMKKIMPKESAKAPAKRSIMKKK